MLGNFEKQVEQTAGQDGLVGMILLWTQGWTGCQPGCLPALPIVWPPLTFNPLHLVLPLRKGVLSTVCFHPKNLVMRALSCVLSPPYPEKIWALIFHLPRKCLNHGSIEQAVKALSSFLLNLGYLTAKSTKFMGESERERANMEEIASVVSLLIDSSCRRKTYAPALWTMFCLFVCLFSKKQEMQKQS